MKRLLALTADLKEAAKNLTSIGHMIAPFAVLAAAITFHALKNPFNIWMFVTMSAVAYGAKMFHDFLQSKALTGVANLTDARTETVTHTIAEKIDRVVDADGISVQPTKS
jgi:hypothetical protein